MVTGGTGFVGRSLIQRLVAMGLQVRTLLRPSQKSPNLPLGIPVDTVICSLRDERGLRAAMKGVKVVFHLAGSERRGSRADLTGVDIEGTRTVAAIAHDAGVNHLLFLSHLGADRASAYPLLQSKAIAESYIVQSGIRYTIFRSAILYGPGDQFTVNLARLIRMSPGIFLIPGGATTRLQPLWIEDLVTCLTLALDDPATHNQVISVGGLEYLTFYEICQTIMDFTGIKRPFVSIPPAYLRSLTIYLEHSMRNFPMSSFWLDYLATDRTCDLNTIPRMFGLIPERFNRHLNYLSA